MSLKFPKNEADDADLDVTAFLNLMIVLVPVLLLSMTFAKVTVLELSLPELTGGTISSVDPQGKLEVVVDKKGFQVFYPETTLIKEIPFVDSKKEPGVKVYDFYTLSLVMQALKKEVADKKDVLLRLDKNLDYQDLVQTMDAVKSYKAVIVTSVEEIELFPEISLGDAK